MVELLFRAGQSGPILDPSQVMAFDYLIGEPADLPVAAVGGVYDLPAGSYAWLGAVALGADRILHSSGNASHWGMAAGYGPFGSPPANESLIEIAAGGPEVSMQNLTVRNVSGISSTFAVRNSSNRFVAIGCDFQSVNAFCIGQTIGRTRLTNCDVSENGIGVLVENGDLYAVGCSFENSGNAHVQVSNAGGAGIVSIDGGRMASGVNGLLTAAPFPALLVRGLTQTSLSGTGIGRSAGTPPAFVSIADVHQTASVATGIDYGVLPSQGLAIFGSFLGAGTPILGFTSATANVTMRGNSNAGGVITETALHP